MTLSAAGAEPVGPQGGGQIHSLWMRPAVPRRTGPMGWAGDATHDAPTQPAREFRGLGPPHPGPRSTASPRMRGAADGSGGSGAARGPGGPARPSVRRRAAVRGRSAASGPAGPGIPVSPPNPSAQHCTTVKIPSDVNLAKLILEFRLKYHWKAAQIFFVLGGSASFEDFASSQTPPHLVRKLNYQPKSDIILSPCILLSKSLG